MGCAGEVVSWIQESEIGRAGGTYQTQPWPLLPQQVVGAIAKVYGLRKSVFGRGIESDVRFSRSSIWDCVSERFG